jgi:phosphoribosyl 1,2-cyclic phosphodiesterase
VELRTGGAERIIFDAGTGITRLGRQIVDEGLTGRIHIFLSHFHWDHIQGLPFFQPLYRPDAEIRFYATAPASEIRSRLAGQMTSPYFPVPFGAVASKVDFIEMGSEPVEAGSVLVEGFPLNHPQGSTGYRAVVNGRAVVYATDHEIGQSEVDGVVMERVSGARVLIADAQYTEEEYAECQGRGHSTWSAAVRLAIAARVGELVLFHHDPEHDDEAVRRIEQSARGLFANTVAAREGCSVEFGLAGMVAGRG